MNNKLRSRKLSRRRNTSRRKGSLKKKSKMMKTRKYIGGSLLPKMYDPGIYPAELKAVFQNKRNKVIEIKGYTKQDIGYTMYSYTPLEKPLGPALREVAGDGFINERWSGDMIQSLIKDFISSMAVGTERVWAERTIRHGKTISFSNIMDKILLLCGAINNKYAKQLKDGETEEKTHLDEKVNDHMFTLAT